MIFFLFHLFVGLLLDVILNIYKTAMSVFFIKSSYFSTVEHHVAIETLNGLFLDG